MVCNRTKNYMYMMKTKQWSTLPDSPVATTQSSVLYHRDCIYRLGGRDSSNNKLSSVYCLDIKEHKWSKCADMLIKQIYPIAVCSNDHLYVVYNDHYFNGQQKRKFQSHQLGSDVWSYKADLPPAAPSTLGASLVSMDDKLYLVGGLYRICAQYSIVEDAWTLLTQCMNKHVYGAAVSYRGKILLCGGVGGYQEIEEYDTTKDEWTQWQLQLPTKMQFHSIGKLSFGM